MLAVLVLAFVIASAYARRGYFVAFDQDDIVVVYRGQTGGFLWFDPTVEAVADLQRDALDEQSIERVESEPRFDSRAAADRFIGEQRDDDHHHDHYDDDHHHDHDAVPASTTPPATPAPDRPPGTAPGGTVDGVRPRRRGRPDRGSGLTMAATSPLAHARRSTELSLVVMAALITAGAYTLASLGEFAVIPARIIPFLAVLLDT